MSSSSQSFEHASCNPLRWTLTSMGVLHLCLHLFLSLMSGLHVLLSLSRRSLITWSPGFTSGDFIFNPVTAGSGVLEIGARQLNNWRLHEHPPPPDFLPFCQPGVPSTRLYNSLMPRHHFRLPGRYTYDIFENQFHVLKLCFDFFYNLSLLID